jgi:hypothetical protein
MDAPLVVAEVVFAQAGGQLTKGQTIGHISALYW